MLDEKRELDPERFLFVASHDMKEPLRMISTYLSLFLRQAKHKLDPKEIEYLGYAQEGAQRLNGLVDSLLSFGRLTPKRTKLERLDLSTVLEDALQMVEKPLLESKAVINRAKLPVVTGDALQIRELFHQLIANALKFRAKDRRTVIEVTAEENSEGVKVQIVDNGIGIKPENHKRIFEAFQRLHSRTEYPGEGMGLAACQKIMELHGGTLGVTSEPGQGSTFYFSLPATHSKSLSTH